MNRTQCRICGNKLFAEPLLHYDNVPASAQDLPDAASLKTDAGVDLDVYQCAGCGLVQLNNEPVAYYKNVIRAAAVSDAMKTFRLKQFTELADKYSLTGKKIIEIGCGRGEYLALMKQCGVEAYGLENLEESVALCRRNELNVSAGFIDRADYKIKFAPFAAFFMLNYLEHLPDPSVTLAGIRNNLIEGGVGLIEVPNFNMILRKKIFSEFIPDHLFYFTRETLSAALNLNGFEVLENNEIWHEYIISAVVRKRQKLELAGFNSQQAKLTSELTEFINRFNKVAIWGAGHQAFALMALAGLGKRVKYVVDSAPFKQGRHTPATHIPIVAPEALERDPVEAVIIMAGGYSDEVTRIARQKLNKSIKVAVLRDYGLELV